MARHPFGGDISAYVVSVGTGNISVFFSAATLTFWDAQAGGSQYTNLATNSAGTTIVDHITTTDGTSGTAVGAIPQFWGPDSVWTMWASANGGPRSLVVTTDVASYVVSNATSITTVGNQLNSHIAAANPHQTRVRDLLDVSAAGPADGQMLQFNAGSGLWVATTVAGLSGLMDLSSAQTVTGLKTIGPFGNPGLSRMLFYAEATGQTADLMQFWSGTDVGQGGQRQRTTYCNEKGELRVICASSTSVAVRIKGQPGQTAHVLEQTDTGNNPLAWWEPNGSWRAPNLGHTFPMSISGTLAVGTGKHRLYNDTGVPLTIRAARVSVGTAPTGAALVCDININGTTIFTTQTNRPTVAAGANSSGKVTAMNVTTMNDGDYLTVDVDQCGSATAGSDLVAQVLAY